MIIVTGHKGYIGSHYWEYLEQHAQEQFVGIDLKEGTNIFDIETLHKDSDVDTIVHFAALPRVGYSIQYPYITARENVLGTSCVLNFARKKNAKVIFISSSAAATNKSPYGQQKFMSELECRMYREVYGLDVTCLRLFNVYSEEQTSEDGEATIIPKWKNRLKHSKRLEIYGDGSVSRDFIHVNDVVDAINVAVEYKFNCQHYDVGSGKSVTIKKIVDSLQYPDNFFHYCPPRKGDPPFTQANCNLNFHSKWSAKIGPKNILRCFGQDKDFV